MGPERLHEPNLPDLPGQLQLLAERAAEFPGPRTCLYDAETDIAAHVRHARKPIGSPAGSWFVLVGGGPLLPTIDCLEIAAIEQAHSIEPVTLDTFVRFIEKLYRLSPWEAVCLDNIYDDNLTGWCKANGWVERYNETDNHEEYLYRLLPADRSTIEGVALTTGEESF